MAVLLARGIRRSFGRAEVLRGATLEVLGGEVHVLAGVNGAGKSTLIRILAGADTDFQGEILIDGAPRRFADPIEARRAGVATIHQELSLVGPMSVADNLLLGREPRGRLGLVDRRRMREEARRLLEALKIEADPEDPVEALPIATQQRIEIAKALGEEARIVILDEPTSALDEGEAEILFDQIGRLKQEGKAILFVSHRMEDIFHIGDRITVLRDGVNAVTASVAELPRGELIRAMLGGAEAGAGTGADTGAEAGAGTGADTGTGAVTVTEAVTEAVAEADTEAGAPRIEVRGLEVRDAGGRVEVAGASFSVSAGEIVGLVGLRGAGASAVLEGISGARGRVGGSIAIDGFPVTLASPAEALASGVAMLAGDRRTAGIVPAMTVVENATLAGIDRFARGPWLLPASERAAVLALVDPLRMGAIDLGAEVGTLSGGSQQKVCFARCLLAGGDRRGERRGLTGWRGGGEEKRERRKDAQNSLSLPASPPPCESLSRDPGPCAGPRVLLLDEPTRGVDAGAKADIHRLIRRLAGRGTAILFSTSEIEELLGLADRVLVLFGGRIVADLPRGEATRARVLEEAMGRRAVHGGPS